MKLKVAGSGKNAAELELSAGTFGHEFNPALVHQVVTAYRNAGRSGTKAQKSRAEVRGGGKKPHSQKGTGQARAGSSRSPIWVGGGVTFAAKPRSFEQKVNRKMYRAAMAAILSELHRQGRLKVVDSLEVEAPKTKDLVAKLEHLHVERPLIVTEDGSEALYLSARNIPYVEVRDVQGMDPVSLVGAHSVVITAEAVKKIEEWLA